MTFRFFRRQYNTPCFALLLFMALLSAAPHVLAQQGAKLAALQSSGSQAAPAEEMLKLLTDGQAAYKRGDFSTALRLLQSCLEKARRLNNDQATALLLNFIGNTHLALHQYPNALKDYQEALRLYDRVGDSQEDRGDSLSNIGVVYMSLAQYGKALEYLNQALQIREKLGNQEAIANNLSSLGLAYDSLGQYEKALDYFNRALQVWEKLNNQAGIANSFTSLGGVYNTLGQNANALDYYQKALALREKLGVEKDIAASIVNIGIVYNDRGQNDKAFDYFQKALAVFEKLGDHPDIAACLINLTRIYNARGQYDKALECCQKAFAFYEPLDDPLNVGLCLNNLGEIYHALSQNDKALECLQKALTLYEKTGNAQFIARSLGNIGNVYKSIGQYDKALAYHQKALALREKIGIPKDILSSYNDIGLVYYALDQSEKAIAIYKKAFLLIDKSSNVMIAAALINNAANIGNAAGMYDIALDCYQRILAAAEKMDDQYAVAITYNNIGVLYHSLKRYDKALDCHQKALTLYEKIGRPQDIARSYYNIGFVYFAQMQWSKAEKAYSNARRAFETLISQIDDPTRLADMQQTLSYLYERYAYVLTQQGHTGEALALLEAGRARGIARQLFLTRSNYSHSFTQEEAAKLKQYLAELNNAAGLLRAAQQNLASCPPDQRAAFQQNKEEYEKRTQEAERRYDVYNAALFKRYPSLRQESGDIAITPGDLLGLARSNPDTLFLTWAMLTDKQTSLYIIGKQEKQTLQHFTLSVGAQDLQKMVATWRQALGKGNRGAEPANAPDARSEARQAQDLYAALLGPAEKTGALAKGRYRRVVVVPSGPLLEVPFAALLDGQGRRLIESWAVSSRVALNTSFWRANSIVAKTGLFCVADPIGLAVSNSRTAVVRREGFGPLPGARQEGLAVAGLFHTRPLIGPASRKADVLKVIAGARLLHFATHGYLSAQNPFYSGLVLAPEPSGSSEDGVLSAREILNLGLAARMAVLSACETGRGVAKGGDGLQGLVWAFQAAGCPCVVASQWSVDDVATRDLMLTFYRGIQAGKRKDEALRNAMLSEMRAKPSPFYWAAFQVTGDTQPIP